MNSRIVLVIGGARSGKSTFAQELAAEIGGPVVYIATAEARDGEMRERIAKHQADRPSNWETVEAPLHLEKAIHGANPRANVILIDCLTLFVSNLFLQELGPVGETENPEIDPGIEGQIETQIAGVMEAANDVAATVIFVSNEVGAGLVPPYNLGRVFRDIAGRVNQKVAASAAKVFWVNCGVAVELKSLAVTPMQAALSLTRQGHSDS